MEHLRPGSVGLNSNEMGLQSLHSGAQTDDRETNRPKMVSNNRPVARMPTAEQLGPRMVDHKGCIGSCVKVYSCYSGC